MLIHKNKEEIVTEETIIELLTLTCEVDRYGTKRYYNKMNVPHRIHGPAITHKDGTKIWCKNGKWHREDGPAIIYADGKILFYIEDRNYSLIEFLKFKNEQ